VSEEQEGMVGRHTDFFANQPNEYIIMATLQTKHMIFLPIGQMSTSSWQHYKPSM
jgi:hypothetical protein